MRNLKKICAATALAMTVTSSGAFAANEGHKVLGLVEFGKTTVPEFAEMVKGKCHPTTSNNSSFSSLDQDCFPVLQNVNKIAEVMFGISEKESPVSAVFVDAVDETNMIGTVKIALLFTDKSRKHFSSFSQLVTALLETTYGNRTIDRIWRTPDYTVRVEEINNQDSGEPERLEIFYISRHAGRIEWYLTNPEFKLNNPEQRKSLEEAVIWTRELNSIL